MTSSNSVARRRVLIIGGGLGGLALAQGLKQAKPPIPFRIFERDTSAAFRAQGYRVRVVGEPLTHLLPPSRYAAVEAAAGKLIHGGSALDAREGKPAGALQFPKNAPGSQAPGPGARFKGPLAGDGSVKAYNEDRTVLRNLLLQGLEDDISFDKRFTGYRNVDGDEGLVEVEFADGTKEEGALVVGADGIRSAVRRQLIPDFEVRDTNGRAVFGKTDLTDDMAARVQLEGGINVASEEGRSVKLFCEMMKFDRAAAADAGVDVPADYVYWVLCFNKSDLSALGDDNYATRESLLALSSTQATELADRLTSGWHDSLRAFMTAPNHDSTAALVFFITEKDKFVEVWKRLREAGDVESSSASRHVTLLGDAAHPMPPVGGVGANAAFDEAATLCKLLTESEGASLPEGLDGVLRKYEASMVEKAGASIEKGAIGADKFFGMGPVEALEIVKI